MSSRGPGAEAALNCANYSDAELENQIPSISWRTPIRISVSGLPGTDFGCRFCIARHGLTAADTPGHPQSREEFDRHLAETHGMAGGDDA